MSNVFGKLRRLMPTSVSVVELQIGSACSSASSCGKSCPKAGTGCVCARAGGCWSKAMESGLASPFPLLLSFAARRVGNLPS